ncbi:MAG: GSCFA domain-containing protein [Bacteroidia bacterium]
MKFRTELGVSPFSFQINHNQCIVLLGSCFSNSIGQKLVSHRFKSAINPHGIVFNPYSLSNIIINSINGNTVNQSLFTEQNGVFKSFEYHSDIKSNSTEELTQKIAVANVKLSIALKKADVVFITLGTSWVYKLISNNQIVANCHKVAPSAFEKTLLSITEIITALGQINNTLNQVNPNTKIVFTISPIRHIKDGIVQNQISKSYLIAAVHQFIANKNNCFYFPSYELMMDDLRDYRFFEQDLVHPNSFAIEYIWQKFGKAFFNESTKDLNKKITKLNTALNHRLLGNSKSEKQKFIDKSLGLCSELEINAGLNLSKEKSYFLNL